MTQRKQPTEILLNLDTMLPELEAVYKDIHAHPELSMQETRTAGIAARSSQGRRLRGYHWYRQDGSCR